MAGNQVFNSTLATGANIDSAATNVSNSASVMVFVKSNQALTVTVKVSPLGLNDATAPVAADYYALGSTLAVSANTPFVQQIAVGGAASLVLNFANASGSTATITAWVRSTVAQIGR